MSEEERVLIELLSEIDEICKSSGARYFLGPEAAYDAVNHHGFESGYGPVTVYMPAEDIYRFIDTVNKQNRKDRYVESLLNNPEYPYVSVRYGNSETLDFPINRFGNFTHFGINIDIEILRPVTGGKESMTEKMAYDAENGWESIHMLKSRDELKGARKKDAELAERIQKFLGRKLSAKATFRASVRKAKSSRYYIKKRWSLNNTMYPESFFDDYKLAELEGRNFRVPVDLDFYLAGLNSKDQADGKSKQGIDPLNSIVDAGVPYEDFLNGLRDAGVDFDDLWSMRKEVYRATRPEKLAAAERKKAWNYIFLCYDRYNMWEKYERKKEKLAKLYESGEYELLDKELEEYIDLAVSTYREKKLGLCFDKDIFEIMAAVLEKRGQGDMASKIRKSVPENHWADIKIMDHKGEYL